jgi:hypothetical protein
VAAHYAVAKPAAHLAALRDEVMHALEGGDADGLARLAAAAGPRIAALDSAMEESGLLSEGYRFDPGRVPDRIAAAPPGVTEREETFARSGMFTER